MKAAIREAAGNRPLQVEEIDVDSAPELSEDTAAMFRSSSSTAGRRSSIA
jgi:hypothetical protein